MQVPEQTPQGVEVPADAVIRELVQCGAVSEATVNLAANLVAQKMEVERMSQQPIAKKNPED